jgi:hypothetical protein
MDNKKNDIDDTQVRRALIIDTVSPSEHRRDELTRIAVALDLLATVYDGNPAPQDLWLARDQLREHANALRDIVDDLTD